jgi:hypothetical protein
MKKQPFATIIKCPLLPYLFNNNVVIKSLDSSVSVVLHYAYTIEEVFLRLNKHHVMKTYGEAEVQKIFFPNLGIILKRILKFSSCPLCHIVKRLWPPLGRSLLVPVLMWKRRKYFQLQRGLEPPSSRSSSL